MHPAFRTLTIAALCYAVLPASGNADENVDWGTFIDPAGDCTISQSNDRVTITVPGTNHNLNPTPKYDNTDGPRILLSVEGDFTIEVKVLPFPIPTEGTSNNSGGHSYCAAGLVVWQDDRSFVRWFRAANGERGDVFVHGEWFDDAEFGGLYYDSSLQDRERRIPDEAVFLRLVRRGNRLTFYRSLDGESWEAYWNLRDLPFGETLQVGVAAVNSATAEFSPVFEDFRLNGFRFHRNVESSQRPF